jgi:succinate dehydrogenase / fumarate reductase flavoprotein subunit/fumarate reductase flavoprotein subunit
MWEDCGVVRTEEGLLRAHERLEDLASQAAEIAVPGPAQANYTWQEALDLANQLTVARTIVASALIREESRGAHYRADFPERNDTRWLRSIVLRNGDDGRPETTFRPVVLTRMQPADLDLASAGRAT